MHRYQWRKGDDVSNKPPSEKEKLTVYITKEAKRSLRKEVLTRDNLHGAQSEIVEEALREKLGLPPIEKG